MKKNLYGYDQELNRLINSQETNDYEVLKVRGKIIKSISKEIKRSENKVIVLELKERLKEELILYKKQINSLLKSNKKADKFSMAKELSLKSKKIQTTGKQISTSLKEANIIGHLGSIIAETISVGFTILKVPVVLSMKLFQYASPVIVYIFTLPVHLAYYIKHKLIKDNSPYNEKNITNVSKELNEKIETTISKQQDKVKRL